MFRMKVVSVFLLAVFLTGCDSGDAIRSYTVPKSTEPSLPSKQVDQLGGDARLLGVMIPTGEGENKWFIKFVGPADAVTAAEKDFEQFLADLRITGEGQSRKLEWKAPESWKVVSPDTLSSMVRSLRLGTYLVGPRGSAIELTISTPISGSVLENVDRWRRVDVDVGGQAVTEATLPKYTRQITVANTKATHVDMRGKAVPKDAKRPPMMGGK
jgi:hypothetical protein